MQTIPNLDEGLAHMDKKICSGCHASVEGPHLVVGQALFHNDCFVCSGCKVNLAGKAATKRNGILVCADCAGGSNCHRCKSVIKIGEPEVTVGSQKLKYHDKCLTCAQSGCKQVIPRNELYISPKNATVDIYCKNHTYV